MCIRDSIVTIHGNMNAIAQLHRSRIGSFQWLAARLEDFTLPRTDGIICISDYVKNLVGRYKVKTWLLPNAIQGMFFDFPSNDGSCLLYTSEIAAAILKLLKNPSERMRLGTLARMRILSVYNNETIGALLEKSFITAVQRHAAKSGVKAPA